WTGIRKIQRWNRQIVPPIRGKANEPRLRETVALGFFTLLLKGPVYRRHPRVWRSRCRNASTSFDIDAVAEEALGIDRIETHLLTQLLAQLADVAFDDIFFDFAVEDAVDRAENLRLVETAAAIGNQIFQDAALAARQRKINAVDLRIAAIGKNADRAKLGAVVAGSGGRARAAADGIDAR